MSEDILKYSSRKVGKHQMCCEKLQIKEGRKQQWPTEKEKKYNNIHTLFNTTQKTT